MKIAMMTRWNVPSGQSSHAEPVVRGWLKSGHDVKVLAPAGMDLTLMYDRDEPFVHRCYTMDIWGERERYDYFFDPKPFLEDDHSAFVVEDAEIMPMPELLELFPQIKQKAKTIFVVHEVGLPDNPNWYKFDWDAIVCFDKRYKEFLAKAFVSEKIFIIPFPCSPVNHGDKSEARKQLGLPLNGKIIFAYGYDTLFFHIDLLQVIENLSRDYPVHFVLLHHHSTYLSEAVKTIPDCIIYREEMPKLDRLYTYLHASDAYINYGRAKIAGVGVSSSVAACLGAGIPVLVNGNCNFFDLCGNEVIKYYDLNSIEEKLRNIFEDKIEIKRTLAAAEKYVNENDENMIAKAFIDLMLTL